MTQASLGTHRDAMPARVACSSRRDLGETPIRQANYAARALKRADAALVTRFLVDFNNIHPKIKPFTLCYSRLSIFSMAGQMSCKAKPPAQSAPACFASCSLKRLLLPYSSGQCGYQELIQADSFPICHPIELAMQTPGYANIELTTVLL